MGKNKKGFKYFTGEEIFTTREAVLYFDNSKKYDDFCKQMNKFWEKERIQEQLYTPSGVATVTSKIYYTAEDSYFLKNGQVCSMEISSSDLINVISNGNVLAENAVYMAKSKYDKFWAIALKTVFSFELDLFDRFITENNFYWNIGIKVIKVGRSSFFDNSPCIYAFQYILFIACNDDDKTITNIKLGLECMGMDKIQKAPKKMGFIESFFYHWDSDIFAVILICIFVVTLFGSILSTMFLQ